MPKEIVQVNLDALARYENGLTTALQRLRNEYARQSVRAMLDNRDTLPLRVAFASGVGMTLGQMAKRAIPFFAKLAEAEIQSESKLDFEQLYSTWINTRIFEHSQIIAETATNEIIGLVQRLIAEDATERVVSQAIWDYSRASKAQSRMIARTETHQAAMFAKKEQALDVQNRSGIEMVKFWNAVEDSRTRESHNDAEADYPNGIGLDEKFMVGGDAMDRPGDPSAGADNLINCRCVLTMRPKGF